MPGLPRFIHGSRSTDQCEDSNWPWMATLGYWNNKTWVHQCGATLISNHHAMTAAHCLEHLSDRLVLVVQLNNKNLIFTKFKEVFNSQVSCLWVWFDHSLKEHY